MTEQTTDPDQLEVAPGFTHERLQGWIYRNYASDDEVRDALEKAFDYRGDVKITRKDGSVVEGYLYDRKAWRNARKFAGARAARQWFDRVSVFPTATSRRSFSAIGTPAAGRSWEAWVPQVLGKEGRRRRSRHRNPKHSTKRPSEQSSPILSGAASGFFQSRCVAHNQPHHLARSAAAFARIAPVQKRSMPTPGSRNRRKSSAAIQEKNCQTDSPEQVPPIAFIVSCAPGNSKICCCFTFSNSSSVIGFNPVMPESSLSISAIECGGFVALHRRISQERTLRPRRIQH